MRLKALLALVAALAAFVVTACNSGSGSSGSAEDYPSKQLDWTIAFGPGGGNDIMARTLVEILQDEKLYPANIAVENREGGSGATGWGYLLSKAGDPLRHLDDVRLVHHHPASGRPGLDLQGLHPGRPDGHRRRTAARRRQEAD